MTISKVEPDLRQIIQNPMDELTRRRAILSQSQGGQKTLDEG